MKDGIVVGLSIEDLMKVSEKLAVLGLDTGGLLEFLDRDKVQLFAEITLENDILRRRLKRISGLCDPLNDEGEEI